MPPWCVVCQSVCLSWTRELKTWDIKEGHATQSAKNVFFSKYLLFCLTNDTYCTKITTKLHYFFWDGTYIVFGWGAAHCGSSCCFPSLSPLSIPSLYKMLHKLSIEIIQLAQQATWPCTEALPMNHTWGSHCHCPPSNRILQKRLKVPRFRLGRRHFGTQQC